ncbi:MAG: hypothetical protein QXG65_02400 [Thermoplasmata archaeon]
MATPTAPAGASPAPSAPIRKRPLGVSIIAILTIIEGLLFVILGAAFILGGTYLSSYVTNVPFSTTVLVLSGAVFVVLGLIAFACAAGLWRLRKWAAGLTIAVVVIDAAYSAYTMVAAGAANASDVVAIALAVIIIGYLAAVWSVFA